MSDKNWMNLNDRASMEYINGVHSFLNFAFGQPTVTDRIRCPCTKCRNTVFKGRHEVRAHLIRNGIVKSYKHWVYHGETIEENLEECNVNSGGNLDEEENTDYDDLIGMVHDAYAFINTDVERDDVNEGYEPQEPNPEAAVFYRLLKDADKNLYPGCDKKVSKRNAANRAKLITKHTCGTQSYAEVEESTRDPETGEKAPPDQVWLIQHTKKNKEGELVWSDPKSKEIHEQLEEVVQQTQGDESQMTRDDILLQVLGQKSGYFRGKGAGKKAPSKRVRYNENLQEEVQRAVEQAKESLVDNIRENVRAQLQDEVRAEIQAQMEEQVNEKVNAMIQARFAAFFETFSQSRASSSSMHEP